MSVAMGVGLIILTVVGSSVLWSGRTFAAMANYAELDNASRGTLDKLTRDIRQVNSLKIFSTNEVTFVDSDGGDLTFSYNPSEKILTRTKANVTETLLKDCDLLVFSIFQRNPILGTYDQYPVANNDISTCKLVQVSWICSRKLLPTDLVNSESVQTAKIVIRKQ
jgi:hypothetical protein